MMKYRRFPSLVKVATMTMLASVTLALSVAVYLRSSLPTASDYSSRIILEARLLSWNDRDPLLADIEAPKRLYNGFLNTRCPPSCEADGNKTGLLAQMLAEDYASAHPFHIFVTAPARFITPPSIKRGGGFLC